VIAVTTLLLTSGFYIANSKEHLRKILTNYFYVVSITILLTISSEMFIQIGYFF